MIILNIKIDILSYFVIFILISIFTTHISFADSLSIKEKNSIKNNNKLISERLNQTPIEQSTRDNLNNLSNSEDVKDQIITALTSLTCQSQGVGNLLRDKFSHTCNNTSMVELLIANILSPGMYADMMTLLKINDTELFPNNCDRDNRAVYDDMKISFGLCNNNWLVLLRELAVANSTIAIAKAMITGEDPWESIKESWDIKKKDYHSLYYNMRPGDSGILIDPTFPLVPALPWEVRRDKDKICVGTYDITLNWTPVGCKYIKEPQPVAMYNSFINPSSSPTPPDTPIKPTDPRFFSTCSGANITGCYQRVQAASKTGTIITSPIITCIQQALAQLMISKEVCRLEDVDKVSSTSTEKSLFYQFQKNIRIFVMVFLSLYVAFYGMKIATGIESVSRKDAASFILKMFLVTYFSVGIQNNLGNTENSNGIIKYVLPFLISGINGIASWIVSSSENGLCVFNEGDYLSTPGMSYLALWDSIDCKLTHYLGLDTLRTMIAQAKDPANFQHFDFSIPPYYFLIIPAIIIGNPTLISLTLFYPIMVISVIAYLVQATVISMIGIVILSFLAPLIVPLYLFNYTRGYFDNWVKLLISFMLQPMIVVVFIVTIFSVYDFGFYGACKYKTLSVQDQYNKTVKLFVVDEDWSNYSDHGSVKAADDIKSCANSLGYMLNNPFKSMYQMNETDVSKMVGTPISNTDEFMSHFGMLGALVSSPGLFFTSPKVIFEKIRQIMISMLVACFTLYLMHNFSEQIAEFVSELALGVSLSNVVMNPKKTTDSAMSTIGQGINSASQSGNQKVGDIDQQKSNRYSTDSSLSSDSIENSPNKSDNLQSPGSKNSVIRKLNIPKASEDEGGRNNRNEDTSNQKNDKTSIKKINNIENLQNPKGEEGENEN